MSSAIRQLALQGQGKDPRLLAFEEDKVLHSRFAQTLDVLAERIQYAEQQSITAVIGPTGSGKTALAEEFEHQFLIALEGVPVERRTSLLSMELAAPELGPFKWADDLYLPALVCMNEPCLTKKIDVEVLRDQLAAGIVKSPFPAKPKKTSEWRSLFYAALDRNNTIAALLDEANHMRRPTSKYAIFHSYDSLKSRSNATETHFVMLGTVEIADIFQQSGPISKRVFPIWLDPYGRDDKEIILFGNATQAIVDKLPVPITFSLSKKILSIHSGSLGAYGVTHEWFGRALSRVLRTGKEKITWQDMLSVQLAPVQLTGIARNILRYREVQRDAKVFLKELQRSIFLPNDSVPAQPPGEARHAQPPFTRKLGRDPVGTFPAH